MTQSILKGSSKSFDRKDWSSAYQNVPEELTNSKLKIIKGSVPSTLKGTFYRNGPGQLERNGQWVHHPFDGDGMISSMKFVNGEVLFSNRFVQTKEFKEEVNAGKFLYRGVFGTQKKGGAITNAFDLRLKNIANTNVLKLGNKLLALWEASNPYSLDLKTLETHGESNLDGILKNKEPFSAHPRFDPGHFGSKRIVTFGVKTGPKSTIRLMEFSNEGDNSGVLLSDRKDTFNGFSFLHDFAITPNWSIFIQNAIDFNPLPYLMGRKGAAQCLSSKNNSKGKFLLIPRESGKYAKESPREIDAPEGFVFHHLNAWEDKEELILESIFYNDFPSIKPNENFKEIDFNNYPEGILKSCKINLYSSKVELKTLSNQCCEFATVNPLYQGLPATHSWMASTENKTGNAPLQSIKKLNLKTGEECFWSCAPRGFVSEPLMIPEESLVEDQGWVLTIIWNGKKQLSELIILNAENLKHQATLELPLAIPHGLHGSWVEE